MLTLDFKEGESFTVAEQRFTVKELRGKAMAILNDQDGIEYTITDDMSEEILPDVFVSLGKDTNQPRSIKLAFDAPREIRIYRKKGSPHVGHVPS